MALNFGGRNFFNNSNEEDIGIYNKNKTVNSVAIKSFIVGGVGDQYDVTAAFAEVTGMTVDHESRTGKVLVTYSCTVAPGVSEIVNLKLQKDGVDVTGTEQEAFVSAHPGTSYLAIPPCAFQTANPDVDDVFLSSSAVSVGSSGIRFLAPVNLPHGAVITACIVYGNAGASDEGWDIQRYNVGGTGGGLNLGSANINTADTSISNGTIDNNTYKYLISTDDFGTSGDALYGAKVTYTSKFCFQGEGPRIPVTITWIDTAAENNTYRILAKTSQYTPDDSFINDRIITTMDI